MLYPIAGGRWITEHGKVMDLIQDMVEGMLDDDLNERDILERKKGQKRR